MFLLLVGFRCLRSALVACFMFVFASLVISSETVRAFPADPHPSASGTTAAPGNPPPLPSFGIGPRDSVFAGRRYHVVYDLLSRRFRVALTGHENGTSAQNPFDCLHGHQRQHATCRSYHLLQPARLPHPVLSHNSILREHRDRHKYDACEPSGEWCCDSDRNLNSVAGGNRWSKRSYKLRLSGHIPRCAEFNEHTTGNSQPSS
jgi:hypothetical protein